MSDALPWRCDQCNALAAFIEPGSDPVRELFLLDSGRPQRCWCLTHWRLLFASQRETA